MRRNSGRPRRRGPLHCTRSGRARRDAGILFRAMTPGHPLRRHMHSRHIRVAFQCYKGEPEEFRSLIRRDAPIPIASASVVGGRAGRVLRDVLSLPVSTASPPLRHPYARACLTEFRCQRLNPGPFSSSCPYAPGWLGFLPACLHAAPIGAVSATSRRPVLRPTCACR